MNFRKCKKILAVFLTIALIGAPCFTEFSAVLADDGNLALNKPVYSGGVYHAQFEASNAVDGLMTTHWASGSLYADDGVAKNTIIIDLEQEYDIDTVNVRSERDMNRGGYTRAGWSIYVSTDLNFENAVLIGTKTSPGEYGEDLEIQLSQAVRGRYVKVSSTTSIVLSEIEVYGDIPQNSTVSYSLKNFNDIGTDDASQLVPCLEIMEGVSEGEFSPLSLLKRKEAVKSVLALINFKTGITENFFEDVDDNDEYCSYINTALSLGIVSASTDFKPDDYVTAAEFYAMILRALGYGEYASAAAAYPTGVFKAASRIGLDDDAMLDGNDCVNRNSALHIFFNALTSSVMEASSVSSKGASYDFGGDKETVLEKYFNMKLYSGIVTANNASTLNDLIAGPSDSIVIGNKNYNDLTGSAYGAIGKNICYLVDCNNENNIMVWWENSAKNEIYEIDCDYLESVNKNSIKCYADEKMPKRTFNITNADILKNGAAYYDCTYDLESFKLDDSYIVLIDNNSDGKIDVVNIMEPTVIAVDTIDLGSDDVTLIGKGGESVKFEDCDNMNILINGVKGKRRFLSSSAVVYAYVSSNKKNAVFDGYTTVVEDKIESIGEDSVTIGGNEYEFSDYFRRNREIMEKLAVGATLKCAIGKDSKLVWAYDNGGVASPEKLGFIAQPDTNADDRSFRIFTVDSEFVTLQLANKLTVDGKKMRADDIEDNPELISRKFAIYKLDSENKIKWIDTESYEPSSEPDSQLRKVEGVSADVCRSHANAVFNGNKMLFPVKDNMKVFVIPYSGGKVMTSSQYESYYYVTEYSKTFSSIGLLLQDNDAFFMKDENGFPLFAMRSCRTYDDISTGDYSRCSSKYAPSMVVSKVSRALNSNSDESYSISGYDLVSGAKINYMTTGVLKKYIDTQKIFADNVSSYIDDSDNTIKSISIDNNYLGDISSLKAGDILKYELINNMLTGLEKVADRDIDSEYRFGDERNSPHSTHRFLSAEVTSAGDGLIIYQAPGGAEIREINKFNYCFVYENTRDGKGTVSIVSPSKLPIHFKSGQRCVVYIRVGRPISIVVYD